MDIKRPDLAIRKRRKQLIMIVAGLGFVAMLAVYLLVSGPVRPKVAKDAVWFGTVKRGEMLRDVRAAGSLVPKSVRWLATETEARVDKILMKAGTRVQPDTVVLELSNLMLEEQLADAESELRIAEANIAAKHAELRGRLLDLRSNLADVEVEYESARLQVEAEKNLVEQKIISRVVFERNVYTADSLKRKLSLERERIEQERRNIDIQLNGERARIEQLRASRDRRRHQVDALMVRAGIDGMLQQLLVQEGQRLAAGANLARVARPDELIAQLRIPEAEARDVAVGQQVTLKVLGNSVPGRVVRVDPAVSNNTVLIDVDPVQGLPAGARPDLSVDGQIELERLYNVLYVSRPAGAQPMAAAGVFQQEPDGDGASRVQVRFGSASVNQIVVEDGLQEGDTIVLSDTSSWENADRIGFK